jgi:hypothetical protein
LLFQDLASSAIGDLILYTVLFALESDFTDAQSSALVSIVKNVAQYAMARNYLARDLEDTPAAVSPALGNSPRNTDPQGDASNETASDPPVGDVDQDTASQQESSDPNAATADGADAPAHDATDESASSTTSESVAEPGVAMPLQVDDSSEVPTFPTSVNMLPSLAETFAMFRKLVLEHSVDQPPDSHQIFSFEQVQAIIDFVKTK